MTCRVCDLLDGPSPQWTDAVQALLDGLLDSESQLHLFTAHLLGKNNLLLEFARQTWNQAPDELNRIADKFLEPDVLGSILHQFGRYDPKNRDVRARRARVEQVWRGIVVTIQSMPALARRPTDATGLAKQLAQAARHFQKAWRKAWPPNGPALRRDDTSFAEQLNMPWLDAVLNQMVQSPRVNGLGALAVERLVRYLITPLNAPVAPHFAAETTILLHDPNNNCGRSARLAVTAWPFSVAALAPDPVTTGIVYLGPRVLASMAHASRLLAPKRANQPNHALLIGITELPDHRLDGKSAGVAVYCSTRAALFGQQLDTDKAVSARLPESVQGPLRSVTKVAEKLQGVEDENKKKAIRKKEAQAISSQITEAKQHVIREVILCPDDHRLHLTWGQSVGVKVQPAATLEDAYRLLCGDARIRRALERYRRIVRDTSRQELAKTCGLPGYILPETAIAPAGLNPFTHVPERVKPSGLANGTEDNHDPYEAIVPAELLASAGNRVCLTEDSGLGKTMFLLWAQGELNSPEADGVAINWSAGDVHWDRKNDVLQKLADELWLRLKPELTTDAANKIAGWLLNHGKVTFLIDALDTTDDEHARALAVFIKEMGAGHACRVILTSRPHAVQDTRGILFSSEGLGGLTWRFAKLKPFDEARQRRFLGPAYGEIHSPQEIQGLLGVPIVLRMIRKLARAGTLATLRTRADVYHAAMLELIERGISTLKGRMRTGRSQQILAAIAFQMALNNNFRCQVDGAVAVERFLGQVGNLLDQNRPTEEEWWLVRALNIATDRSILEGLEDLRRESIGFRHRSVMEFFAAMYLTTYAEGFNADDAQLGSTLRAQMSSGDWYWVWQFAIDMPAAARDPATSGRTLAVLFQRPPQNVARPSDLIYCAWDLMKDLPGGRAVLEAFQSEFQKSLGKRRSGFWRKLIACVQSVIRRLFGDKTRAGHEVAAALHHSFVRCPNRPSLDNQPFLMGSPDDDGKRTNDETQHRVIVTPFLMSQFTITNSQYELFDPSHRARRWGSKKKHPDVNDDECPVVFVSWYAAWAFCRWLGEGYGLPTEAQWENACRAGTTTAFHYGDSLSSTQANIFDSWPFGNGRFLEKTTPVGSYAPNAWGLFDMHGNVQEWCADWYDENYYSRSPERDPTGPETGSSRVLRGGSWSFSAWKARSAIRKRGIPDFRVYDSGFRVVCSCCVRTP